MGDLVGGVVVIGVAWWGVVHGQLAALVAPGTAI